MSASTPSLPPTASAQRYGWPISTAFAPWQTRLECVGASAYPAVEQHRDLGRDHDLGQGVERAERQPDAGEFPLRYASVRGSSTSPKMPARSGWRS